MGASKALVLYIYIDYVRIMVALKKLVSEKVFIFCRKYFSTS